MEQEMKHKIQMEAMARDRERAEKIEAHRQKTEALIDAQFALAERNRQKMMERERKVRAQLEEKKSKKTIEITEKKEKAKLRIAEALNKHHELHEIKEREFHEREEAAAKRAKEVEKQKLDQIRKEAEEREKMNRLRTQRLEEAARIRREHREEIIARRMEKDKTFSIIQAQRNEETEQRKFNNTLKKQDKLDNVERVNRMNEFRRLQTLQTIIAGDLKYEKIQEQKMDLIQRHREEVKASLNRKHEIANAMDIMRVTNDYSLLDQLFNDKKNRKSKKNRTDDADDDKMAQTI
jgi:hypothetical protein